MSADPTPSATDRPPVVDEGGDPACWAHLVDDGSAPTEPRRERPDPLGPTSWAELADHLADAVLVADRDGTITYWNQAAQRLFGWTAVEAVGASLDLIIPERQRARHWEGYRGTIASGETKYGTQLLEVPALRRDGQRLSIAFTLTLLTDPADQQVSRLVAVVRDDTARWNERRELRAELASVRAGEAPSPSPSSSTEPQRKGAPMSHAAVATEKVPGHWLLARLGKRVLRPGGRQLTDTMLGALDVGPTDRVVELAPGMGATARSLLARRPASYTAVDADAEAAATTRAVVEPSGGTVVVSPAQHVPLPDHEASVVVGEAMLTMQSDANKATIIAEAARLLGDGGRYAIHELCLVPDDVDDGTAKRIWDDLSRTIHVGARPLTVAAWRSLLEAQGFTIESEHRAPMALLSPKRIVADEGYVAAAKFFGRLARDRAARARVREMRQCFDRWSDHLAAVAIVARRSPST